jgi:phosphoribosylformylglycinamidine synthase subunit PurSL
MAHRIEVALATWVKDAPGNKIRARISSELGIEADAVQCIDVYTLDVELTPEQLSLVAGDPLCDPIIQRSAIDSPLGAEFDWAIEVAYRPGVTDNVGRTAAEAVALALDRPLQDGEGVYTSRQYLIRGKLDRKQVKRIATELLSNELIQRSHIMDAATFETSGGFPLEVPRVSGAGRPGAQTISLQLDDQSLVQLSHEKVLALSLDEMHALRDYFDSPEVQAARRSQSLGNDPTDVEIEALAQTWSEHCKHKIFNARIRYRENDGSQEEIVSLFDSYIRGATERVRKNKGEKDLCLSVFSDNAGVIKFNDDWSLVFKVETHNSPSALDPYGGALTGIVGVNRDPFGTGMGARLIFNTDVFCFASPFRNGKIPKGLLHPRRVLEGVREGVEHGGNKSGIPTINGSVLFDERYLGKPLVYCGTAGLLPTTVAGKPGHEKQALPGDRIVMVGGRIGKDGIHGATFSSEELHEGSPATAVQIGDPITQKRMTDFLLRARDEGLYRGITDNGAGGLSSSVGEMATDPGGCDLDLTHAPLKYAGLAPWEILLSEAQERMTVAVAPEKIERFMELAERYQVEATDLGDFNDSGYFKVSDNGRCVAFLKMDFLHDGVPRMDLAARWSIPDNSEVLPAEPEDHGELLKSMLARLNICSKAYWVRQYDHEVQAGTVIKPLTGVKDDGPSDAAVFRPLLDSMQAVVVSHGICPRYSDLDTYAMAAAAVDEAVRNAVAVGADPGQMAGLDNFCWCDPVLSEKNPDGDFKLGQLVRANRGLYDTCVAYGIPCISGKDSMKNDAVIEGKRISIPPTLLFSLLGRLDDASRAVSMDAKCVGDLVYVLGITRLELGASEYFGQIGVSSGAVPIVHSGESVPLYRALHRAIWSGCVSACHDMSDGGLGVALAEVAFAGGLGMEIDLGRVPREGIDRDDLLLYSESQSRFVVTVPADRKSDFEEILDDRPMGKIGTVTADGMLTVDGLSGEIICSESIEALRQAWLRPLAF